MSNVRVIIFLAITIIRINNSNSEQVKKVNDLQQTPTNSDTKGPVAFSMDYYLGRHLGHHSGDHFGDHSGDHLGDHLGDHSGITDRNILGHETDHKLGTSNLTPNRRRITKQPDFLYFNHLYTLKGERPSVPRPGSPIIYSIKLLSGSKHKKLQSRPKNRYNGWDFGDYITTLELLPDFNYDYDY